MVTALLMAIAAGSAFDGVGRRCPLSLFVAGAGPSPSSASLRRLRGGHRGKARKCKHKTEGEQEERKPELKTIKTDRKHKHHTAPTEPDFIDFLNQTQIPKNKWPSLLGCDSLCSAVANGKGGDLIRFLDEAQIPQGKRPSLLASGSLCSAVASDKGGDLMRFLEEAKIPQDKWPSLLASGSLWSEAKTVILLFRNGELKVRLPDSGCPLQPGTGHGQRGRAPGRC